MLGFYVFLNKIKAVIFGTLKYTARKHILI